MAWNLGAGERWGPDSGASWGSWLLMAWTPSTGAPLYILLDLSNHRPVFEPPAEERSRGQLVYSDEVLQHTRDETAFLEKHAKAALKLLEAEGGCQGLTIEVDSTKNDGKQRRRNTYPRGARIKFVEGTV